MNRRVAVVLCAYLLAIAAYFTLGFTGRIASCEWFMIVPTLVAAAAAFTHAAKGGWLIPLALLCSAAGDYGGAVDAFIPQVTCFAIAHSFYIDDFAPRYRFSRGRCVAAIIYSLPLLGYLLFILMHSHSIEESVVVGIYGAIILTMGLATIFQERKHRTWYIVAATIFIFSDSVIVYTRFIDSLPHAGTFIMATYYTAQGLFLTLHALRHSPQE